MAGTIGLPYCGRDLDARSRRKAQCYKQGFRQLQVVPWKGRISQFFWLIITFIISTREQEIVTIDKKMSM